MSSHGGRPRFRDMTRAHQRTLTKIMRRPNVATGGPEPCEREFSMYAKCIIENDMKGAACYKLYDAAARCYDENTRVGKAKASAARAKVKRQFIARFARKSLRR